MLNFTGAFGFACYTRWHTFRPGSPRRSWALVPLAILLLALVQRQERLRRTGVVGGILALAGVAVISNASVSGSVPARGRRAILTLRRTASVPRVRGVHGSGRRPSVTREKMVHLKRTHFERG